MTPRIRLSVMIVVVVALLLGTYWFLRHPDLLQPQQIGDPVLACFPSEAPLVAAVHVEALRQHVWLPELLKTAAPVEEAADYRQFVTATGFDYTRDLDHLWLAILPARPEGEVAGVAEGRFDLKQILAYALAQHARQVSLGGVNGYIIDQAEPKLHFAFAFPNDNRVAFAKTQGGLEKILACIRDAAPSVADDALRRTRVERFAAGMDAWAITEDVAAWSLPGLEKHAEVTSQLRRLAVGGRVTSQGIDFIAQAETHEPSQAVSLKLRLQTYGVAARTLLSLKDDASSLALREILGSAALAQRENELTLRLKASRAALTALLNVDGSSVAAGETERR